MSPPPGEGGGWVKRPALDCFPSDDFPLSLLSVLRPFFMCVTSNDPDCDSRIFQSLTINIRPVLVFFIIYFLGRLSVCIADCFAFTVCQEGEMFCQANRGLIFLEFGSILLNVFADLWTDFLTQMNAERISVKVKSDEITTSKMPLLTCIYFKKSFDM